MSEYRTHFELVNVETGEILTRNNQFLYVSNEPACRKKVQSWLDCFFRGLDDKGLPLRLCITARKYELPPQPDVFD